MRGYAALRTWIVLGLVAALILPLFGLCPCGQEWLPSADRAQGMDADHACCASRAGWQAQDESCCSQMSDPSRESAEAAARVASPAAPAVLALAAELAAPVPAPVRHAISSHPLGSPPGAARPAVLRV